MEHLVLIVEDEPPQAELLSYNLQKEGFRVLLAQDGEEGLLMAQENAPDAIVLDWMLPGLSGIEVCRQLRGSSETREIPILMLTARGEEEDRVRGIETGADDYVVKPYSPREVVARLKALLRRANPSLSSEALQYADIAMDLAQHKVNRGGQAIHLGPTEFRLLKTLMERPSRVFSRERLLDLVWGRDVYVEDRTVDVHIRRLRKALNDGGGEDVIRTVRGEGYAIDLDKGN
ncbi:phosphate regulon transcriptional regulator PhoB [Magnetovibrio blakemorei]|uniref:Phosphate regulon transcriptional regulatory protein PhoB n=1 Tax=Magnetovibrio blakemorei TaxID=28181 RepID=A0A1E5Q885_9PROT|nr:phosphate regulon transcriptional regulator PhoB [Magnetovibrio blakemorei]OEJ67574.1 phosphate regulon transcriptional regulatory protein PhoB [Magnetovibrio blakemorei]